MKLSAKFTFAAVALLSALCLAGALKAQLVITNPPGSFMPPGVVGTPYQFQFQPTGGNNVWEAVNIPSWATFNAGQGGPPTGLFVATNPPAGTHTVEVKVWDFLTPTNFEQKAFSLTINTTGGSTSVPASGSGGCALVAGSSAGGVFMWSLLGGAGVLLLVRLRRREQASP